MFREQQKKIRTKNPQPEVHKASTTTNIKRVKMATMPIETISLVPTVGETSPTSVMVDVTADCRDGVRELKRILKYSHQLFIPVETILGNDLIKVWKIDDELQVEKQCRMDPVTVKEEAIFNRVATATMSVKEATKEKKSMPITTAKTRMEVKEEEEEDELMFYFKPRPSCPRPEVLPPPLSPLSPSSSPSSEAVVLDHGTMNTIVLDNDHLELGMHLDLNEEPEPLAAPSGRNRRHRRNHSHFDFRFQ